jgi:hypothetical protein
MDLCELPSCTDEPVLAELAFALPHPHPTPPPYSVRCWNQKMEVWR